MSERLLRHRLESVYGVRSAVHVRGSHVWRVAVYTLDPGQREPDIARRFDGLGTVTSCTLLTAGDPGFRKFAVILVAKDLEEAAPSEGVLDSQVAP